MWVVRGAIPGGWWLDLVETARRRKVSGVSLDLLARWARDRRIADAPPAPPRARRNGAAA